MARLSTMLAAALLAFGAVSANPVARANYNGAATWTDEGLGACGKTSTNSELVVGVSQTFFNAWPGYNGKNPNKNPLCGKKIVATYKGKTVTATVSDSNPGAPEYKLNFSPTAFGKLANTDLGVINGVEWHIE